MPPYGRGRGSLAVVGEYVGGKMRGGREGRLTKAIILSSESEYVLFYHSFLLAPLTPIFNKQWSRGMSTIR